MKKTYLTLMLTATSLLSACGQGAKVTKIEASFNESKTYLVGEKIAKSAITVNATYSDGKVKAITDWTCPDLTGEYLVTEADGASRSKEFTISFDGATTKVSTYTFDGKVSVEEYNHCLNYLQNGNNRTEEQNYRVSIYGDEMIASKLLEIQSMDGMYAYSRYYDVPGESYFMFEHECNFAFEKDDNNQKYYVSYIDTDLPSENTFEDFDDLNISAQADPRSFDLYTRSYSYQDPEFGNVKSKFEYIDGEIRLNHFSYLFEGSSIQNYVFDQYGEVEVVLPECNGLFRPSKSATENEYVHNLPNFGTDVHQYCFDFTLEANMINPFFQFYSINDTTKKFAMYYLTLIINGEYISLPTTYNNGLAVKDGVLTKGTTIQIYCGYFQPAAGQANAEHVAKLIQLVD